MLSEIHMFLMLGSNYLIQNKFSAKCICHFFNINDLCFLLPMNDERATCVTLRMPKGQEQEDQSCSIK